MILSDHTILKRLMNNEFGTNLSKEKTKIGPASIDFQIDDEFLILETYRDKEGKDSLRYRKIDLVDPNYPEHFTIPGNLCFLGSTNVSIEIPSDLCAHVQGRSSIGRLFLEVHQTAGFIDPGFKGKITLEFKNNTSNILRIPRNEYFCQLIFEKMDRKVCQNYDGVYLNQNKVTGSKFVK